VLRPRRRGLCLRLRLHWPPLDASSPDMRGTLLPSLRPTVVTDRIPQRQEWIHTRTTPMHPGALQSRLDHQLIRTFHHPTADRPALHLKGRILHVRLSLLQIGQILCDQWHRQVRSRESAQSSEQVGGAMMFELVQLAGLPGPQAGVLGPQDRFTDLADPLRRVREREECG